MQYLYVDDLVLDLVLQDVYHRLEVVQLRLHRLVELGIYALEQAGVHFLLKLIQIHYLEYLLLHAYFVVHEIDLQLLEFLQLLLCLLMQ